MDNSCIVALSTAVGRGAVAIIRLSGSGCIELAGRYFSPMPKGASYLKVGKFTTPHFIDRCMCVYFVAPHSYTGEDMVEIHCHGGMSVVEGIISTLIGGGARMAQNGEFSKRAFVNGKQNLSCAEGIIEMIDAESVASVKTGSALLANKLGVATTKLQDNLTDIISSCEVALDYPEEDLDLPTLHTISAQLENMLAQLDKLLSTVTLGRTISSGLNIAIVGKPNVGKSSLLNSLIGSDRAIVSHIEGTTRDTITESIVYRGIKYNFVDTAGLRETTDYIEGLGIQRTLASISSCDVVLHVVDSCDNADRVDSSAPIIKIYNKCDTYTAVSTDGIAVSAKLGTNVDSILSAIYDMHKLGSIDSTDIILTNSRHIDVLTNTRRLIAEALADCETTMDCVAVRLHEAWQMLGEITGTTANQEIIDRIYSRFCLGK